MELEWIFDPAPPSRSRKGGLANAQVFDATLDAFVREVLQNTRDQHLPGERVEVRVSLTELAGPRLESFLAAIAWPQLSEHVEATARPELVTIGPRLTEGLGEVAHGRLRVLRIQDSNTRGLTGGEDDDSNFAALVRHELITSADRRESGGSFGLGKSVLWRFSNLSTVLFHSFLSDQRRSRFIGRTVLAGHEAEGERWEGSGWFGLRDPDDPRWAKSIWDEPARAMAYTTELDRPQDATGTSILIVGFDDPGREVEGSIDEICEGIVASATRWFWPSLLKDELSVLVEGYPAEGPMFSAHAQPTNAEVAPFVQAREGTASVSDTLEESGDVAEREISVTVPRQKEGRFERSYPEVQAAATLRVRLAESGENDHRNSAALQRGSGMVVQYRDLRTRTGTDQGFHAVLLAGRAHGDSDADKALEAFLRAAEPPAHEEWTHKTERIRAEYVYGFRKALDELFAGIDGAVRELTREDVLESDEGPDALKKLFPLPGTGGVPRAEVYRLADAEARLDQDRWVFSGRYLRNPLDGDKKSGWQFNVALAVDQEGTGRPTRIPVAELQVGGHRATVDEPQDGTVTVHAPAGANEVAFSGTSQAVPELPPGGHRRVRLRMDLKADSEKGTN
jgi:hypothetical protein